MTIKVLMLVELCCYLRRAEGESFPMQGRALDDYVFPIEGNFQRAAVIT